ncbi:hypothetical protein AWC00_25980 [Mycobacterium conspicuum]|nr:hypothetical protein AWC00_25980 [Mycobacterium conspicuum]
MKMVRHEHRGARDVTSRKAVESIWSEAEKAVRGEVATLRRRWIETSLIETHLQKWWDSRSDDQRAQLKQAADSGQMAEATARLLMSTGCPIGPVGTKWEDQPEYAWSWPEIVRGFIAAQPEAAPSS